MPAFNRPGTSALLPAHGAHPLTGRTLLQVVPELEAGGAERTAVDIASALAAVGARALVLSASIR